MQTINKATDTVSMEQAETQVWTTPSIETYDVAQFTLGTRSQGFDADVGNRS